MGAASCRGFLLDLLEADSPRAVAGSPLSPPLSPLPLPQAPTTRIAWSFFAGALGAWVISSPPSYVASGFGYGAGAIGLVFYSLSSGLPVIMIAFAGSVIRVSEQRGVAPAPLL